MLFQITFLAKIFFTLVISGGGNCSVSDTIMDNCFRLSWPPTTTLIHHVDKCFWVAELDTTTLIHHVDKCFWLAESGTTPFIHQYAKCMWQIFEDTTPFVHDLKKIKQKYINVDWHLINIYSKHHSSLDQLLSSCHLINYIASVFLLLSTGLIWGQFSWKNIVHYHNERIKPN